MIARIVLAQGLIDGVNRVFATGEPYVPGQTAYVLNGRIHSQKTLDSIFGFIELDAAAGTIQVDVAPQIGDVVQIFYWSRAVAPPPPVERLTGTVSPGPRLQGVLRDAQPERLVGIVKGR